MRRALWAIVAALTVCIALRSRSQGARSDQGAVVSRLTPAAKMAALPAQVLDGWERGHLGRRDTHIEGLGSRRVAPRPDDPGPGPWITLYNGRSGALSARARPDGSEVVTTLRSEGAAPVVEAWVASTRVDAGSEVMIFARARGERSRPVEVRDARVYLMVRGALVQSGSMARAPEGQRQDFQYGYRCPSEVQPTAAPLAVDYAVRVEGRSEGREFDRVVLGGFRVHSPGATMDPLAMSAQRESGDLTLSVRVAVTNPGTYGLWAELWSPTGDVPIAFARERFDGLQAGSHTLSVRFGGQIIRDRGLDGPYSVRNVRWSSGTTIPPHEQRPAGPIDTPAWRSEDFF